MRISKLVVILLLCTAVLAGCWDKVEIEDRVFVLGIGIDKATEEEKAQPTDRYAINFASPIVGALKEGGDETFSVDKTVSSIFTFGLNQMYERIDKKLSFQHTRILIFGEDMLKDEKLFKEVLDAVGRSNEFHRNMYVFAVPGKAEEVFKVKPKYNKLLASYIAGIAENNLYQSSIYKMPAYQMYDNLTNFDGNTIIPSLRASKEETKVSGVGIIKNYKLVGYLDDKDSETLNWLNNTASGGIIEGKHNEILIPYKYNDFNTNLVLDKVEGDKIYLTYNMVAEGSADAYIWGEKLMDQTLLNSLEKSMEATIEERGKSVVDKFQKELKVDLVGIASYLRKHHPQVYNSIEKDYENFFQNNMVIKIKAEVSIRRVGTIE
ncbi:MAG TPA: Ger(x)C family spore germination protein [Patescibacteria group bacterium]|nr:Ger(x)C family spore germination protein [Patescibacteria group bacterium]